MEVVNKSTLKIEDVSPVVEYFKTEDRKKETTQLKYDVFKTGYSIRIHNADGKQATVKVELLLDYLGEGRVFSYTCYDVVEGKKTKSIDVMLDNVPVECIVDGKKQQKESRSDCQKEALVIMTKHIKKLTIERLK